MLPIATSDEGWGALMADDDGLRAGVEAICRRHGVSTEHIHRFADGSVPVYALGAGFVLKLFPPPERAFARTERLALEAVAGGLLIPTPEVVASGCHDGWPYLLMTRLGGMSLAEAWPRLGPRDRDLIATELGRGMASLHRIDSGLDALRGDFDFSSFVVAQRDSAVDRQRQRGLDDRWLEQIQPFLERHMPPIEGPRVLLHTELMREHLMVCYEHGPVWALCGLFDFEPAMVGAPEYELASFGLFVSCGDGRFLRRALLAYGMPEAALDESLRRRLMAYTLLHRYSNLPWYLERMPPAPGEETLEALADRWWSLQD